ncbi:MAG TPA: hypothetical protein DHV15_01125 [Treponema sp.]|nr:hypothetical protein [Treponema sp.]
MTACKNVNFCRYSYLIFLGVFYGIQNYWRCFSRRCL